MMAAFYTFKEDSEGIISSYEMFNKTFHDLNTVYREVYSVQCTVQCTVPGNLALLNTTAAFLPARSRSILWPASSTRYITTKSVN